MSCDRKEQMSFLNLVWNVTIRRVVVRPQYHDAIELPSVRRLNV